MNVILRKSGRVVIPAAIREQLDWSEGISLELSIHDRKLELCDRRQNVNKLLDDFSKKLKCASLSKALIEDRRREAAHEEDNYEITR